MLCRVIGWGTLTNPPVFGRNQISVVIVLTNNLKHLIFQVTSSILFPQDILPLILCQSFIWRAHVMSPF